MKNRYYDEFELKFIHKKQTLKSVSNFLFFQIFFIYIKSSKG
jgi:hypothetical protein